MQLKKQKDMKIFPNLGRFNGRTNKKKKKTHRMEWNGKTSQSK